MGIEKLDTQENAVLPDEKLGKTLGFFIKLAKIKTLIILAICVFVVLVIGSNFGGMPVLVAVAVAAAIMFRLFLVIRKRTSALGILMGTAPALPVSNEYFEVNGCAPNAPINKGLVSADGQAAAVLSGEELGTKLRSLNNWTLIKKFATPVGLVFVVLIILSSAFYGSMSIPEFAIKIVLPAFIVMELSGRLLTMSRKRVSALKSCMGAAVTLPVIKEIFEVKNYQPLGHIRRRIINGTGLVDNWTEITGSDYIEGSYKGINILYSDLHLQHYESERDSDGKVHKRIVTDFKGQWMTCDFGKELAATLRLIDRNGISMWSRTYKGGKSDIETENIAFNEKFKIATDDGHSAFYLLTPHFMERVVAAGDTANSYTHFCFMDGIVHIAMYSERDSFELNGVKLDNMDNVRQKFRRDLKYMTDIMDELLLNDKLFKEA